jgi:hypothetical protein
MKCNNYEDEKKFMSIILLRNAKGKEFSLIHLEHSISDPELRHRGYEKKSQWLGRAKVELEENALSLLSPYLSLLAGIRSYFQHST